MGNDKINTVSAFVKLPHVALKGQKCLCVDVLHKHKLEVVLKEQCAGFSRIRLWRYQVATNWTPLVSKNKWKALWNDTMMIQNTTLVKVSCILLMFTFVRHVSASHDGTRWPTFLRFSHPVDLSALCHVHLVGNQTFTHKTKDRLTQMQK